jgi:hypothetical protein
MKINLIAPAPAQTPEPDVVPLTSEEERVISTKNMTHDEFR